MDVQIDERSILPSAIISDFRYYWGSSLLSTAYGNFIVKMPYFVLQDIGHRYLCTLKPLDIDAHPTITIVKPKNNANNTNNANNNEQPVSASAQSQPQLQPQLQPQHRPPQILYNVDDDTATPPSTPRFYYYFHQLSLPERSYNTAILLNTLQDFIIACTLETSELISPTHKYIYELKRTNSLETYDEIHDTYAIRMYGVVHATTDITLYRHGIPVVNLKLRSFLKSTEECDIIYRFYVERNTSPESMREKCKEFTHVRYDEDHSAGALYV